MKMPKPTFIALFCLILCHSVSAQVRFPVTNNDLRNNLQKVIADYPNHFTNLKSTVIEENPQTVEYASTLDFKDASENSITEYKSRKPIYSWQATLLTTEDYAEAAKKYQWLYSQLKVMTITMQGGYSYSLNGNYDAPSESRKFSSSVLHMVPSAINLSRLKIEASMRFEFPEWKVSLLVYEKERDDKDRGEVKGD